MQMFLKDRFQFQFQFKFNSIYSLLAHFLKLTVPVFSVMLGIVVDIYSNLNVFPIILFNILF